MRKIECPECCGNGTIDEGGGGSDLQCGCCHGRGEMNIREWLFWKFLDSGFYEKRSWIKLNGLLWDLKEIGERKVKR